MNNLEHLLKNGTSQEVIDIIDKDLALSQSNPMWHGRALSLLIPVVNSLVWMRNYNNKILTSQILADYLYLNKVRELYETDILPNDLREKIYNYLISLPCYDINLDVSAKQSEIAIELHLYIQISIAYIVGDLSGVENMFYKQIFKHLKTENIQKVLEKGNAKEIIDLLNISKFYDLTDNASKAWQGRLLYILVSVIDSLIFKRNNFHLSITLDLIKDSLNFENIKALSIDENIPDDIRNRIHQYLNILPGLPEKQADFHGFVILPINNIINKVKGP